MIKQRLLWNKHRKQLLKQECIEINEECDVPCIFHKKSVYVKPYNFDPAHQKNSMLRHL